MGFIWKGGGAEPLIDTRPKWYIAPYSPPPCIHTSLIVVISLGIRVVNVFIFFKKRSFRYENDDENRKTKRSFLKTIVF